MNNEFLQTEEAIVAMLKTVYDPEIPVNVYDLGLIYKVDIDEEMDLASRFQVMSVPTLIYFKNGQEVNKTVGLISPAELEAALEKAK